MKPYEKLRSLLDVNNCDAIIIPHQDEWGNEYLNPSFERLAFATGFTGSSGCAVIGKHKALFLTDGRYTLQAEQEVDSSFFEKGHSREIQIQDWILKHIRPNARVSIDPKCFSVNDQKRFESLNLIFQSENWVDQIWENRPKFSPSKHFAMDSQYIDLTTSQKISKVFQNVDADYIVLNSPESICWLLNERGHDVPHTPVFLEFMILEKNGTFTLQNFEENLSKLKNKKVLIDPQRCSLWIEEILKKGQNEIVYAQDPCLMLKACKTPAEIKGMRQAHRLDALAMIEFLADLESKLKQKTLTEIEASDLLEVYRSKQDGFLDLSFATISGANANGAIIHYRAKPETCGTIDKSSIYLLDSGGQYTSGTTDITRTLCFGNNAPEEIKKAYTAVLKGVIHLSQARFPKGTTGHRLDSLARFFLWQEGLDYDHGTGHGVGCVLSVHEGPQSISSVHNPTPLKEGMIVSIEPGYYKPNHFGIRIENLALVKQSKYPNFLEFETLTLVPLCSSLINSVDLNSLEKQWILDYHARIEKEISTLLSEQASRFLKTPAF